MPARCVEFPAFRRYEATRQEANNALMAMLAGSQLAAHTLQLTSGSQQLLPDIFPGVAEIQYFRLRTDEASQLLADVGHHLGAVAVPYVLALHEDFVMTTHELLRAHGYLTRAPGKHADDTRNPVRAWNMHEALALTVGAFSPNTIAADQLEIFHLLREMRNCQIHAGGRISPSLHRHVAGMSGASTSEWARWARRTPQATLGGGAVHFTKFDIFTVLANAKRLGREVNSLLATSLSAKAWAEIAVKDYASNSSKAARSDAWARSLIGHVRLLYAAVNLTDRQVLETATALGYWAAGHEFTPRRAARGDRRARNRGTGPSNG